MTSHNWRSEHSTLIKVLRTRMRQENCTDIIDDYEELMSSVWRFTARLLGDGGTKAVVSRAIQLAARDVPLLGKVKVGETVIDFGEFRLYVTKTGCTSPDVLEALLRLGIMTFQTLTELSGDAVTGPLLKHLEEKPRG